jgi:hypothetical protein
MTAKPVIDWNSLDFAAFAKLAGDERLSKYERIGFPDAYRVGYEEAIFADICAKLPRLADSELTIMDIGPGCSDLPRMLIDRCNAQGHRLVLVDSDEMLAQLPDASFIDKRPGLFPKCFDQMTDLCGQVHVLICYSVFHYIFVEANPFEFIDRSLELLAPGGEFLIGDIPNLSKRRRFFSSSAGIAFHRESTGADTAPDVQFNVTTPRMIDDSVVLSVLQRARASGADAYVLPQPDGLPMSNRREDVLIRRP